MNQTLGAHGADAVKRAGYKAREGGIYLQCGVGPVGEICEGSAGCKDTMWKEGVGGTAFVVGTRVEGTSGRGQGQQGQGQR